jgi:aminopeptidase
MSDADLPFDTVKLDKLAEVAVQVGLGLQPGQELVLTAPVEALPLVRRIAAAAYRAGAANVTPILSDEEVTLARFEHGHDAAFDSAPGWLYNGMAEAFANNAARLAISADNPLLLKGQDPDRAARVAKASSAASKPAKERIVNFEINWNIVSYPGRAWARQVFPDLSEDEAVAKLADAIFAASRVDRDDPVAEWQAHNAKLRARTEWLNDQAFSALHFTGGGTDLTVGLAEGHEWKGGASQAKNGITCNPNIPTEEVFTTPHKDRVDGVARASKPLVYQGTPIENIEVRFEAGRIVEASASEGEASWHGSPISQSGLLFFNTLYDENAACHIAQGQCYSDCFVDEIASDPAKVTAGGGNSSLIHVDWMIGGPETDIDGIKPDGTRVPVFRNGAWAQDV